jgi:hypothetical protein
MEVNLSKEQGKNRHYFILGFMVGVTTCTAIFTIVYHAGYWRSLW